MPRWPRTALTAALRRAQRWRSHPGVLAIGIGQRRRAGHWVDGPPCVVVKVQWKLAAAALDRSERMHLPRWIEVTIGGRRRRVPVDVQETHGQLAGRIQGCAGGELQIDGQWRGAVGPVVASGGAVKILISGHVGGRAGVRVVAGGIAGTTEAPRISSTLDHCLVLPDGTLPLGAGALIDGSSLSGVTPVGDLAVGQTLYFHRAATGTRTPVVLRQLDISAPFQYPDGIHQVQHLIATDGITADGDSGALLFDGSFGAVGTLVGLFGNESYFIPCQRAFSLLGLGLIT